MLLNVLPCRTQPLRHGELPGPTVCSVEAETFCPVVLPSLLFSKHARLSHRLLTLNRLFPFPALLLSPKKRPFIIQDPI